MSVVIAAAQCVPSTTVPHKVYRVCLMRHTRISEPFILLEEPVEEQTGTHHEQQRGGVAELPFEFGHDLKVHAVDGANDGGHHE